MENITIIGISIKLLLEIHIILECVGEIPNSCLIIEYGILKMHLKNNYAHQKSMTVYQ